MVWNFREHELWARSLDIGIETVPSLGIGLGQDFQYKENMFPEIHIERFQSHIQGMVSVLTWIVTTMETVPKILSCMKEEQLKQVFEVANQPWVNAVRNLYQRPDLYKNPPDFLPVDPSCSGPAISDHTKERLGRNYPAFDFLNAPYTHPLGTQISLICINYAWDAYDTFVKQLFNTLEPWCEKDERLSSLRKDNRHTQERNTIDTLKSLGLWPEDEEVIAAMQRQYRLQPSLKPDQSLMIEHIQPILKLAKILRNSFVHRFARASPELEKLVNQLPFQQFGLRILGDHFEVTLGPLPKHVAEVIQTYAHLIQDKSEHLYGGLFSDSIRRS